MKKTIALSAVVLSLAGLSQLGCYVERPERVVYREAPPPAPAYEEQYRPLPAPPPPAETVEVVEGPEVQVTEFHEQLAPYGRWVAVAGYGDCFIPAEVAPGWRPYTMGHWVYTDSGMCWVSDERWGWATYHYGRWAFVDDVGWVWVPGSHWGPAWVAWRNGGGYCGWAPLPPRRGGVEVVEVTDADVEEIPPTTYIFCEERYVTAPRVYTRCVPPERNVTIVNRTTNITNITVVNNHVVNKSWNTTRLQEATGRTVRPVRIHEVRTVEELKASHPAAQPRVVRTQDARPDEQERTDEQKRAAEQKRDEEQKRVAAGRPENEQRERDHPAGDHPAPAAAGGDEDAAYNAEVQQINQAYAQEKAAMNQRFAMERRQPQSGTASQDIADRQAREAQALESRHQKQLAAVRKKYHK